MSVKEVLKAMRFIHIALCMGVILFFVVVQFLTKDMPYQVTDEFFVYTVPALAIVGLFAGRIITRVIFSKLDMQLPLIEKLKKYQTALIIRCALLEMPALFSTVAFLQTQDKLFIYTSLILIVALVLAGPYKMRIAGELKLSEQEVRELNQV